ncbi:hypothetical protein BC831DRAFT_479721 [Entophlyctis helioformis]|nr:hypothetical protein BC831DRAFT_479721 [Entophlyctis helioformis]
MHSPLLALSNELLLLVVAHAAPSSVASLARVCARLAALVRSPAARRLWLARNFPLLPNLASLLSSTPTPPFTAASPPSTAASLPTTLPLGSAFSLRSLPVPPIVASLLSDAVLAPMIRSHLRSPSTQSPRSPQPPHAPHAPATPGCQSAILLHYCAARGFTACIDLLLAARPSCRWTVPPAVRVLALHAAAAHGQTLAVVLFLQDPVTRSLLLSASTPPLAPPHHALNAPDPLNLGRQPAHVWVPTMGGWGASVPSTIADPYRAASAASPAAAASLASAAQPSYAALDTLFSLVLTCIPDHDGIPLLNHLINLVRSHFEPVQQPPSLLSQHTPPAVTAILARAIPAALRSHNPIPRLHVLLSYANTHPEHLALDWAALPEPHLQTLVTSLLQSRYLSMRDPFLYYDLLELVIARNYAAVARSLVARGLGVGFQNNWPLRLACVHNAIDVARVFLESGGADARVGGDALVAEAAAMGRVPLLLLLLAHARSAEAVKAALLAAVEAGRVSVVSALLGACGVAGALPNTVPASMSVHASAQSVASVASDKAVAMDSSSNSSQIIESALRYALRKGNPQIIFLLLSHGANVCATLDCPKASLDTLAAFWVARNHALQLEISSRCLGGLPAPHAAALPAKPFANVGTTAVHSPPPLLPLKRDVLPSIPQYTS